MVQLETDVADGLPGRLGAWVTLELFQSDSLGNLQGKRHGGQVLCISILTCINGALYHMMGIRTLKSKIWRSGKFLK